MLSKMVIKGAMRNMSIKALFIRTSFHLDIEVHTPCNCIMTFSSQICKNLLAIRRAHCFEVNHLNWSCGFLVATDFAPFFPVSVWSAESAERNRQRFPLFKVPNYFFSCYILFFLRVLELLIDEGKASFWWQQVYLFLLV